MEYEYLELYEELYEELLNKSDKIEEYNIYFFLYIIAYTANNAEDYKNLFNLHKDIFDKNLFCIYDFMRQASSLHIVDYALEKIANNDIKQNDIYYLCGIPATFVYKRMNQKEQNNFNSILNDKTSKLSIELEGMIDIKCIALALFYNQKGGYIEKENYYINLALDYYEKNDDNSVCFDIRELQAFDRTDDTFISFINRFIKLLKKNKKSYNFDEYDLNQFHHILSDIYSKKNKDFEKSEEALRNNINRDLSYSCDYIKLANLFLAQRKNKEFIELMESGHIILNQKINLFEIDLLEIASSKRKTKDLMIKYNALIADIQELRFMQGNPGLKNICLFKDKLFKKKYLDISFEELNLTSRRQILKYANFPATKQVVNILKKVSFSIFKSSKQLKKLRAILRKNNPQALKYLSHRGIITITMLDLLNICPELLTGKLFHALENPFIYLSMKNIQLYLNKLSAFYKLGLYSNKIFSWGQIENALDNYHENYSCIINDELIKIRNFQIKLIQDLKSSRNLWLELNDCLKKFPKNIFTTPTNLLFYRLFNPELGIVILHRKTQDSKWYILCAKAYKNKKLSKNTTSLLKEWLKYQNDGINQNNDINQNDLFDDEDFIKYENIIPYDINLKSELELINRETVIFDKFPNAIDLLRKQENGQLCFHKINNDAEEYYFYITQDKSEKSWSFGEYSKNNKTEPPPNIALEIHQYLTKYNVIRNSGFWDLVPSQIPRRS